MQIKTQNRLMVTSKTKMGAGINVKTSYSGGLVQTIWFHLHKPDLLRDNISLGEQFVQGLNKNSKYIYHDKGFYLWKNVGYKAVLNFIRKYKHFQDESKQISFDSKNLINYIERVAKNGELSNWTVALTSQKEEMPPSNKKIQFGDSNIEIIPRIRSRLSQYTYKTGVLSDPNHLGSKKDVKGVDGLTQEQRNKDPNQALLLLYVLWSGSEPKNGSEHTEALFQGLEEKVNVLGYVIDFPLSKKEPNNYIAQIIN